MIFKELRPLICSPLKLVIGKMRIVDVSLDTFTTEYDNYEVIGIRSEIDFRDKYSVNNSRIVVSLSEKDVVLDNDYGYNNIREHRDISINAKENSNE